MVEAGCTCVTPATLAAATPSSRSSCGHGARRQPLAAGRDAGNAHHRAVARRGLPGGRSGCGKCIDLGKTLSKSLHLIPHPTHLPAPQLRLVGRDRWCASKSERGWERGAGPPATLAPLVLPALLPALPTVGRTTLPRTPPPPAGFLTSQSCDRRSRDGPLVLAEGSHGRSPAPFSQWGLVAAASDRPLVDPPATFSLGNWGRYDDRAEGWRRYGSRARCHYLLDSARGCRSSAVPYFSTAGGAWALERVAGTADQFRIVSQVRGCGLLAAGQPRRKSAVPAWPRS